MAQKLDENELVSFKELLMANSIQVDAFSQVMIGGGINFKKIIYLILFICFPLNLFGTNDQLSRTLYDAIHFAENGNDVLVDLNTIKSSLAKGANPNYINLANRRSSVLGRFVMLTCITKNPNEAKKGVESINLLFKNNAKLQYCDKGIIFWPIAEGKYEIVEILLEKGASAMYWPNDEIGSKLTPIDYALGLGHYKIADLLAKYGAQKVSPKKVKQLQFIETAAHGSLSEMDKLIKKGADVNGKNADGKTALIQALFGFFTIETYIKVKYLLDIGADVNLKGKGAFGKTTLLHAATYFSTSNFLKKRDFKSAENILKALIEKGAFISGKDEYDKTPLHIAAWINNLYAAQLLLESDAKVMPRDKTGKTPLDYAESREMIRLLKKHGAVEQ